MNKYSLVTKWYRVAMGFAILFFAAGFLSACSQAGGYIDPSMNITDGLQNSEQNSNNNGNNQNGQVNNPPAGFDYYQLYSSVTSVTLKYKKVYVRTQDGRIIEVPMAGDDVIDLMKISTTDGVSVRLPGTGQETVVEVILRVKDQGENQVVFSDGRTCKMKTPAEITLFARAALVLDRGVPYKVHASFDPLEALNLNCGDSNAHVVSVKANGDALIEPACDDTDEKNCRLRCSLANSRFEISGVEFDEDPQPTPNPDDV